MASTNDKDLFLKSLDNFLFMVSVTTKELEFLISLSEASNMSSERHYRTIFVRTLFSSVEGFFYSFMVFLKGFASLARAKDVPFDVKAIEKYDEKNSKGRYSTTKETVTFVDEAFQEIISHFPNVAMGVPLDRSSDKWQCFLRAIKIRDRVMHPKSGNDLLISDMEYNDIEDACEWYFLTSNHLHEKLIEWDKKVA